MEETQVAAERRKLYNRGRGEWKRLSLCMSGSPFLDLNVAPGQNWEDTKKEGLKINKEEKERKVRTCHEHESSARKDMTLLPWNWSSPECLRCWKRGSDLEAGSSFQMVAKYMQTASVTESRMREEGLESGCRRPQLGHHHQDTQEARWSEGKKKVLLSRTNSSQEEEESNFVMLRTAPIFPEGGEGECRLWEGVKGWGCWETNDVKSTWDSKLTSCRWKCLLHSFTLSSSTSFWC